MAKKLDGDGNSHSEEFSQSHITKELRAMNGTVDMQDGIGLPDPTIDLHWDDFRGPITSFFDRNAQAHPERTCVVGSAPAAKM